MNTQQVTEVMAFMGSLWPKSGKMDEADSQSWRRTLSHIQHPDIARQALVRLKDTTDFDLPKRERFLGILSRQTGKPREEPASTLEFPGYIICTSAPPNSPGQLGHFIPLAYAAEIPPDQTILADLQRMAQDRERLYGGTWEMVREPGRMISMAEMTAWMHQLRKTVPFSERPKRPKSEKSKPACGSLRSSLLSFFAGGATNFPPPEDAGPPPSDDEASSYAPPDYQDQQEPF